MQLRLLPSFLHLLVLGESGPVRAADLACFCLAGSGAGLAMCLFVLGMGLFRSFGCEDTSRLAYLDESSTWVPCSLTHTVSLKCSLGPERGTPYALICGSHPEAGLKLTPLKTWHSSLDRRAMVNHGYYLPEFRNDFENYSQFPCS
jgi:hypothetical protein